MRAGEVMDLHGEVRARARGEVRASGEGGHERGETGGRRGRTAR